MKRAARNYGQCEALVHSDQRSLQETNVAAGASKQSTIGDPKQFAVSALPKPYYHRSRETNSKQESEMLSV